MGRKETVENIGKKAWVVAVNMGYGHQRTAYPLKKIAFGGDVINANDYLGIPQEDKKIWESTRGFYEFISNFKRIPLLGEFAFSIFDKFQQIPVFYPYRDLSKPTYSLKKIFSLIDKGWGKDLIQKLASGHAGKFLPIITTFFTPAFMAEAFNYPGEIFCIICDADISRAWVSLNPAKSRINYFAPNSWVVGRLRAYGVPEERIFLSGYPLPQELIGTEKMEILKKDLGFRLLNLDPERKYYEHYKPLLDKYLGRLPDKPNHLLTLMLSIGGAGAQKEMAARFLKSLAKKISNNEIKIILTAGIKKSVQDYFLQNIKKFRLESYLHKNIEIIFTESVAEYFREFNDKLHQTDILWTKPSELTFYAGLGIPIIVAPSIGSQEDFNKKWLLRLGAAIFQENPDYANQWIFDYIGSGRFAETAMQGFIEIEKMGAYRIPKICFGEL